MMISFDKVVAIVSTLIAIVAIWLSMDSNRRAQRLAIREATEAIYREWWSEELHTLRRYFYEELLPKHIDKILLTGRSIKDIEVIVPDDKGRARQYCYFFDKVGWLGAAKLIDVDYILPPMQHYLRRTWIAMEPLIHRSRIYDPNKPFDPVYQWGVEWLFLRSSQKNKHQARLLRHVFSNPSILTKQQFGTLTEHIEMDELNYRGNLERLLKKE